MSITAIKGKNAAGEDVEWLLTDEGYTPGWLISAIKGEDATNNVLGADPEALGGLDLQPAPTSQAPLARTLMSPPRRRPGMCLQFMPQISMLQSDIFSSTIRLPPPPPATLPFILFRFSRPGRRSRRFSCRRGVLWPRRENFPTGVAWSVSTANATYTAATASEHNVHVQYI